MVRLLYYCADIDTVLGVAMQNPDQTPELFWDATYAIAMALIEHHPDRDPETVGLYELSDLVTRLPGFLDDPALANERILQDILITWYEEASTI